MLSIYSKLWPINFLWSPNTACLERSFHPPIIPLMWAILSFNQFSNALCFLKFPLYMLNLKHSNDSVIFYLRLFIARSTIYKSFDYLHFCRYIKVTTLCWAYFLMTKSRTFLFSVFCWMRISFEINDLFFFSKFLNPIIFYLQRLINSLFCWQRIKSNLWSFYLFSWASFPSNNILKLTSAKLWPMWIRWLTPSHWPKIIDSFEFPLHF